MGRVPLGVGGRGPRERVRKWLGTTFRADKPLVRPRSSLWVLLGMHGHARREREGKGVGRVDLLGY